MPDKTCLNCFNCKARIPLPPNWREILDGELHALQSARAGRKRDFSVPTLPLSITGKIVRCSKGLLSAMNGRSKDGFILPTGSAKAAWAVRNAEFCGAFEGEES